MNYLESMNYGGYYNPAAMNNYAVGAPVNAMMPAPQVQGGPSTAMTPQANVNGMQSPALSGWQKFDYVMDGLSAIGGLWGAIQQNKIAKQQLALSREAYNTNMNNTIKTYNTALEDRIRARYTMEGRADQADAYIDEHKLTRDKS